MGGERQGPRRAERHQQRHDDLRLADGEAPERRQREHAENDPCSPVRAQAHDRQCEADDEERLPDPGSNFERQERQRPEDDRQQRRIAIELVVVGRRRLVVQRQSSVEPCAGVVIGVDIGERVRRQVKDERLDAERQPEDGRAGEDATDVRGVERGQPAGGCHGDHPSGQIRRLREPIRDAVV